MEESKGNNEPIKKEQQEIGLEEEINYIEIETRKEDRMKRRMHVARSKPWDH